MKKNRMKSFGLLIVVGFLGMLGFLFGAMGGGLAGPPEDQPPWFSGSRENGGLEVVVSYLPLVQRAWSPEVAARDGLVISEVMYDPLDIEPGAEWIEIFNPGFREVDLGGFKVGDEELIGGSEGMLRFPEGALIPARGVVLIANQAVEFHAIYGFYPDFEMRLSHPDVPTLATHTAWAGGNVVLLNTSDEVLLLNERDDLVDAVSWGSSVFAFDPPAPDVPAGHTLERVPATRDLDQASDWEIQPAPGPGVVDLTFPTPTPGPTESQTATPTGLPTETVTSTPTDGPTPTPTHTSIPF